MAEPSNRIFSKNMHTLFFMCFATFAFLFVIWFWFSHILSPILMKFRLFPVEQLYKLYSFVFTSLGGELSPQWIKSANPISGWFGAKIYGMGLSIRKYNQAIDSGYIFTLWELIKAYYHFGITYLTWIYAIPIYYFLTKKLIKQSESKNFTTNHTMISLIKQERSLYPVIYPVSDENLIDSSDTTGNYPSPLTEQEFATRNNLFIDDKEADSTYRNEFGQEFKKLNKEKAKMVFDNQLKDRFQGFDKMAPHRQAVFVILGVMLLTNTKTTNYKKKYADPKVNELAKKFYDNGNKLSDDMYGEWVLDYYNMFKDLSIFNEYVLNRHAYELTAFMTMIQGAGRQQGIINATSMFWWLRAVDYPLFLALNYVGRQNSSFVEIAGVVSHWIVETKLGMPIIGKRTESAVQSLETNLYKFTQEGVEAAIFKPS